LANNTVRLLIAEDDYLVNEEIKRSLKYLNNYEIAGEASNGEQALNMAAELKPDAILMDIKMPKMDGLEASRLIQEKCPTPVVILTAYGSDDLLNQASMSGVGAYLTKPPISIEIDRAIKIAMARHHDLMEMRRLNEEFEKELEEKTLKGIIPVCCVCGTVRDDSKTEHGKGKWMKMDQFILEKTNAAVSHTYCPKCVNEVIKGENY